MLMPNRHGQADSYRYGFNGMEADDEIKGQGNSYTTQFRKYDPRIGRWFSIDPKSKLLPFESPYSFANNMPVVGNDPDGDICVPCVIIILAVMTAPETAMAPGLNMQQNSIAYQKSQKLKARWLLTGMAAGGLAMNTVTSQVVLQELKTQFYLQLASNTVSEGINLMDDKEFSLVNLFANSFSGLDLFDAAIGRFKIGGKIGNLDFDKIKNVIASAVIDLTPGEISALGLNKEGDAFTIDLIFNSLSEFTNLKLSKAKLSKVYKEILDKIDKVVQGKINNEIKNQIGEKAFIKLEEEINHQINLNKIRNKLEIKTRMKIDNTSIKPKKAIILKKKKSKEVKIKTPRTF